MNGIREFRVFFCLSVFSALALFSTSVQANDLGLTPNWLNEIEQAVQLEGYQKRTCIVSFIDHEPTNQKIIEHAVKRIREIGLDIKDPTLLFDYKVGQKLSLIHI